MFERSNLCELALEKTRAHEGVGLIEFVRIADRDSLSGECNFIDLAVLPPGSSIGHHRHAATEEEFYLVLEGRGQMRGGEETFEVGPGDFIRNPPGGQHGLDNTGTAPLRIFVFEVAVR